MSSLQAATAELQSELLASLKSTHKEMLPQVAVYKTEKAYPSIPETGLGHPLWSRHCLVAVGATTTFSALVETVFSDAFIRTLIDRKYTRMTVQCGRDSERFAKIAAQFIHPSLQLDAFDFIDDLSKSMLELRGDIQRNRCTGVLICHAGTGTVLDALRVDIPIIVVPNEQLKDNHQVELAEELQREGYAIHGKLDDLAYAMEQSDLLTRENAHRWPGHPIHNLRDSRGLTIWDIINIVDKAAKDKNDRHSMDTLGERVDRFLEMATDEERELYNRLAVG